MVLFSARSVEQSGDRAVDLVDARTHQAGEVEQADAGEIVAVAGLSEIAIGETIADADNPTALPTVEVDQPTVQMTFGVNTSPFAGNEGKLVTSRQIRDRLYKELETNVALRVTATENENSFLVSGRGELHLAVLIEQMRREGYELQVSQPEVIVHREGDKVLEPYEELTIQVPETYQGTVIEELGKRRGELRDMGMVERTDFRGPTETGPKKGWRIPGPQAAGLYRRSCER